MNILSHRGLWQDPREQNTVLAIDRAFQEGFGLEVDVRDLLGTLVIAHDPPHHSHECPPLLRLVEAYKATPTPGPVALNIKSCGLAAQIAELFAPAHGLSGFVFDLPVPEILAYLRCGVPVFTRQSEYEREPVLYEAASGIWLDEFTSDWITQDTLRGHASRDKRICIVSPELHGRPYLDRWHQLRRILSQTPQMSWALCTDHPKLAEDFFHA